jgi:hypothetical protein
MRVFVAGGAILVEPAKAHLAGVQQLHVCAEMTLVADESAMAASKRKVEPGVVVFASTGEAGQNEAALVYWLEAAAVMLFVARPTITGELTGERPVKAVTGYELGPDRLVTHSAGPRHALVRHSMTPLATGRPEQFLRLRVYCGKRPRFCSFEVPEEDPGHHAERERGEKKSRVTESHIRRSFD